jgi:CheY-like chemotaxis protein
MNVFVIDDNELHLKMCKILLNNLGHEVNTATSLDTLKDVIDTIETPDVVLIDYRLNPGETGVDVLHYLKNEHKWNGSRMVALTADISEKSTLESAGFKNIVFKPVTESLLKEIIK